MRVPQKRFSGRQGAKPWSQSSGPDTHDRKPPPPAAQQRHPPVARRFLSARARKPYHRHFACSPWQRERIQRLARICRALDKGRAAGKRLRGMFRFHVWRWKARCYTSAPLRRVQFSYATLNRAYYRWRASGGNPQALAHRWRPPVKLRKGQVLDFARACINSDVRSLFEAYGRLPRPRATVFAYRIRLKPKLLLRIVRLFAARRLVECRARNARAALNALSQEGGL